VAAGDDGRIERFVEKPRSPTDMPRASNDGVLASMGIYVFGAAFLEQILHIDASQPQSGHDFGSDILARLIEGGGAYSYAFRAAGSGTAPGYWRDIGTLNAYWRAHMELLGPTPLMTLDDLSWPVGRVAAAPQVILAPTTTAAGGTIEDSVVSAKCNVAGHVQRSVLSDDVEIARGARVAETVVLPGGVIGAGSRLRGVIVDAGYRVPEGTVIERYSGVGEPPVLSAHGEKAARDTIAR
jgi:glucose-1-phosphate adenylyltransferase